MSDLAKIMDMLHKGLAQHLLQELSGDEPSPQMLEIARKFLKDNGIDEVPSENTALGKLAGLKVFQDDDPDSDSVTH